MLPNTTLLRLMATIWDGELTKKNKLGQANTDYALTAMR